MNDCSAEENDRIAEENGSSAEENDCSAEGASYTSLGRKAQGTKSRAGKG